MQDSSQHLEKLVAERHADVAKRYDELLNSLAKNNQDQVNSANSALFEALEQLGAVVARGDWPDWLADLHHHTRNYRTNHKNGLATWVAHLKSIIRYGPEIQEHVWFSGPANPTPKIDVDEIIQGARSQFKIDELFDRVVETLRSLAACDELDSAKAIADLQEVILIMQKARKGSFTGQVGTWQFVRRFMPNLISAYIKRSAISGPAIEAFEQTANELDVNLGEAKDQIAERLIGAARDGFKTAASDNITAVDIQALSDLSS
ncbi:hypothetical protein [Pontixanthobacter aquaemixtae]|uniref:Uncharacterized protein n=1 Tax=Pontixanthobacter aquaemixtae TaxID=1958940 RepID=A0A844ZW44_9SPHN|nr:hypothetical protein [Pontixanthobacter aquaemixtae]MXO91674.1 hypothetical protein [Pontixanthobacter aquaemixtae]